MNEELLKVQQVELSGKQESTQRAFEFKYIYRVRCGHL